MGDSLMAVLKTTQKAKYDALLTAAAVKVDTMTDKGVITDITKITETGIYEGMDVLKSPVQGGIMVLANKDAAGNMGFFVMGDDGKLHTGGKPANKDVFFSEIAQKVVSEGDIPIDADYSGGYGTLEIEKFTGKASHNLLDGKEHTVNLVLDSGEDFATTTSRDIFYLIQSDGELGKLKGASGNIDKDTLKDFVAGKNLITMKYTAPVAPSTTDGYFMITDVQGYVHQGSTALPVAPTADGDYKLHIASGVATWVTV